MLLRKMGVQDAARNLRDERRIAREGEAHRFCESAGDAALSQPDRKCPSCGVRSAYK